MEQAFQNLQRRAALGRHYGQTLFVLSSGQAVARSHCVKYRFKPTADFWYLLGINVEDAFYVQLGAECLLFTEPEEDIVWGEQQTLADYPGLNLAQVEVRPKHQLRECLLDLVKKADRIAIPFCQMAELDEMILQLLAFKRNRAIAGKVFHLTDSRPLVGVLRAFKTPEELACLIEAGSRSARAHQVMMEQHWIGKTEKQVANYIEGQFLLSDLAWTSYETIVGSGVRSTILHARATEKKIISSDVVLVDAGAEYHGYCADITRVVPAGQTFTNPQKEVYSIVLKAQKAVIESVQCGVTLRSLHQLTLEHLREGLLSFGWPQPLELADVQAQMIHSTSHWLGLDVHDPSPTTLDNGMEFKLQPGMAFTVEPGLYFRGPLSSGKYSGIGVRIEDNVVIQLNGVPLVTTGRAPKEIAEIEGLRCKSADKKFVQDFP